MNWLNRNLSTWQGRITTGVALVAAVVAGLWPDHPRSADGVRITAVAVAAVAWLFAELAGAGRPREHDLKLFGAITSTVADRDRRFLSEQDFHNSFQANGYDGIETASRWSGATHEFVDPKLQRLWLPLRERMTSFLNLLATTTGPVGGNVARFTAHPTQGDPDNPAAWTQASIDRLNADATALHVEIENFERHGRRRLGL